MYNSIQNDKTINNDLQKITQKTKDGAKRTPLKPGLHPSAPEGKSVPEPLVAPVVLLQLQTR